ncbi:hypothetical protein [Streptomyces sp. NPDC001889]
MSLNARDQFCQAPFLGLLLILGRATQHRVPDGFRDAVYAEMAVLNSPILATVPHLPSTPRAVGSPNTVESGALRTAATALYRALPVVSLPAFV